MAKQKTGVQLLILSLLTVERLYAQRGHRGTRAAGKATAIYAVAIMMAVRKSTEIFSFMMVSK